MLLIPQKTKRLLVTSILICTLCISAGIQKTTTENKGRLPNNYGKIGLSDLQKQKIYKIQAEYNPQIEKLEKELQNLKDKQDKDIAGVLSAAQAKLLHELELPEPAKSKTEKAK
jgi:hypothetical protein